jgi:dipeptidyl aminopeptidase/acylaminoacyl peptidase
MKILLTVIYLFVFGLTLIAQKKQLNHTVYDDWKSLKNEKISDFGGYSVYEINPHRGDGYLYVHNNVTSKLDSFPRGKRARMSHKEDVLSFLIDPGYDTLRSMKLEKVKKEKMIKDSLAILFLENDSIVKIPNVLSFKIPENESFIAYQVLSDSLSKEEPKKKCRLFNRKKKEEKIESKGNRLVVLNAKTLKEKEFKYVSDYGFNNSGTHIYYVIQKTIDKKDSFELFVLDLKKERTYEVDGSFASIKQLNFSKKGAQFAFMASNDTVKENKSHSLYYWDLSMSKPQLFVDTNRSDIPSGVRPSIHQKPYFSLDESKLFFGLEAIPPSEVKDTLLDSEKAKLDLWHYEDNRLQPQQLKELKRDEKDNYLSVIHLNENRLVQLESDTLKVRVLDQGDSGIAMGVSRERYQGSYNWTFPWPSDYYEVNTSNGNARLIAESIGYSYGLSPSGSHFVYFDPTKTQLMFRNIETNESGCITCDMDSTVNLQTDINGMPFEAGTFGIAGYAKAKKSLLFHSEFDVWEYDFDAQELSSLTKQKGRQMKTELRLKRWNTDSTYINLEEVYFLGFNKETKDESIFGFQIHGDHAHFAKLKQTPHKIVSVKKAKNSTEVVYRKMNVKEYPDLYLTNVNFDLEEKISNTNPQQSEYIWPTVEKIEWTSYEGKELEGLIYKPENFDSTKSYPMMVYFYELYNHRYNHHYIPKPTASIIYPTEYASAGYIVFIPDVRYEPGYPARGAYDCIMSGTDEVLEKYPNIDSTRMALQGQSWGGYQTAQLVTMTNRYKAAMAGAPVSNMFSAYGGIRWGSGLNRQFQYEKTQSRIGKTIWEAPELYVENSPIFGIPDIETPLLIMHNDGDGAVPWYQGIEMFVGMKRLGKPVWMLNYNGDQHNLMKNANRVDLSIRMRQFFDYYLQNEPAPKWLVEGIPAIDKGEDYGLEEYEED